MRVGGVALTPEILRHGKQAQDQGRKEHKAPEPEVERQVPAQQQQPPPVQQPAQQQQPQHHEQPSASTTSRHERERESERQSGQNDRSREPAKNNYREEAERIVAEEKAEGERMPKYDGLEEYQLVEKMGDGAFSNVYKAIDKRTGKTCAVKVVRKYELSSTQVRLDPPQRSHPEQQQTPQSQLQETAPCHRGAECENPLTSRGPTSSRRCRLCAVSTTRGLSSC